MTGGRTTGGHMTGGSGRPAAGRSRSRVARWPARLLAVLAALVLALLVTAGPASAHDVLISSDPADGATVNSAPVTVSLTFDQPVQNLDPVLRVIGPNGNVFTVGGATVSGDVVTAAMGPAGPAGRYRMVYRIISADGHPVTGQLTYTLSAAAAGTATGQPTGAAGAPSTRGAASEGAAPSQAGAPGDPAGAHATVGGLSVWLWVGIGIAAVLVVVAIAVALRKPRSE